MFWFIERYLDTRCIYGGVLVKTIARLQQVVLIATRS